MVQHRTYRHIKTISDRQKIMYINNCHKKSISSILHILYVSMHFTVNHISLVHVSPETPMAHQLG